MLVVGFLRHEIVEEPLHVAPRPWRGVFHHRQAATGVLNEDGRYATANAALVDLLLHLFGDLIGAFALGPNFKVLMSYTHNPRNNIAPGCSRALIFSGRGGVILNSAR